MKMVRRFLHALTLGRNDTGKEENMDKMTELMTRYPQLEGCRESIEKAMDLLRSMYAKGGKLLACGNGGSSADCEHIVGELMKSFLIHRPMTQEVKASLEEKFPEDAEKFYSCMQRGIPAISLPSQTAVLSAYVNSTGTVLSLSAVAALWSASRGMYSFLMGLNAVYEVKENRGYLKTRLLSVGYTFAFLLVLVLTLVLHVFGADILRLLHGLPIPTFLLNLLDMRVFVLLVLQTALFCGMFMVLPNEKNSLRESLPGALLTSIGWQVFTNVYSVYSQRFTAYASIYGSVYVVALGMLWLYFCICIVFYGGVCNKILRKMK